METCFDAGGRRKGRSLTTDSRVLAISRSSKGGMSEYKLGEKLMIGWL